MGSNNVNSLTYNSYGKLVIDGKTIFDYSSVNVNPADVKSGLKYVNKTGQIITGSMPSIGNKTYTPTTTEQILPVNTLIGQNVKVAGDQNLISSKILEDTSIFGVQGNAVNIPIENYNINGYYAICMGTSAISFGNDANIYGVIFRNCTTTSASSGFNKDTNLKYVYGFPSELKNGFSMFYSCTNLTNFNVDKLPTSLTNGNSMFYGCSNLTSANFLSEGLSDVTNMFNGCTSLTSVDYIPSTISAVASMFTGCSAMRTINTINCSGSTFNTISNGIKSYLARVNNIENLVDGSGMFRICSALTYANFYKSANTLADMSQMFYGANVSPIIGFQENNKIDFPSLTNCYRAFYTFNGSKWDTIRISSKTTSGISFEQCFQSASAIKKVILNIPNSSTVIMTNMFKGCTTLTDLYINTKVTPAMSQYCFNGKTNEVRLNIYIPSGSAINTAFYNSGKSSTSYFPRAMNWTLNSDGSYYNTTYNYYIYPTLNSSSTI